LEDRGFGVGGDEIKKIIEQNNTKIDKTGFGAEGSDPSADKKVHWLPR